MTFRTQLVTSGAEQHRWSFHHIMPDKSTVWTSRFVEVTDLHDGNFSSFANLYGIVVFRQMQNYVIHSTYLFRSMVRYIHASPVLNNLMRDETTSSGKTFRRFRSDPPLTAHGAHVSRIDISFVMTLMFQCISWYYYHSHFIRTSVQTKQHHKLTRKYSIQVKRMCRKRQKLSENCPIKALYTNGNSWVE